MYGENKIVVILPAFNASLTLEKTFCEIPFSVVDDVVLVDDCSSDSIVEIAQKLGIKHIIRHEKNSGFRFTHSR